jgi:hypothetical protein
MFPSSRAPDSINPSARATVLELPCQKASSGAVSGRRRKHGRKPASCAAAAVGKNFTFSCRGVGAGQKWPTVDSGCRDSDEQPPIETTVSCFNRAVASVVIHVHARIIPPTVEVGWRISDLYDEPATEAAISQIQMSGRRCCATIRDTVGWLML